MKLIKFLNYPYPFYENALQSLKICLGIGVFITSFCFFFRPFGLDKLPTLGILGYGLVSFLVCGFYIIFLPYLLTDYLRNKNWKIYKEILWILLINVSLAFANYFYSGFIFKAGYQFNFKIFLLVLSYTVIVAIIPAITIILYKQLFVYKKIINDTQKIGSKLELRRLVHQELGKDNTQIIITSENKNEELKINKNDFLFISSSGNYIEVYYRESDVLEKKLIRNNISKIEDQLKKMTHIMRCHRSHIVNLNRIRHITGNLQGYQLHFDLTDQIIPVSRSFSKKIKQEILNN